MAKHFLVYPYRDNDGGIGDPVRLDNMDWEQVLSWKRTNKQPFGWSHEVPAYDPEDIVYINVYMVTREFGGPEEGGWYYDNHSLIECIPMRYKYAEDEVERMENGEYSNKGRRELSSVLSTGRYSVLIEDQRGESETRQRPHYE
jgi:hypothetical protein